MTATITNQKTGKAQSLKHRVRSYWQKGNTGPLEGHRIRAVLDRIVDEAVRVSLRRLEGSVREVGDSALYPTYGTPQRKWQLKASADWTSGFYPGCLWYAFELSRDPRFEQWAQASA